MPKRVSPHVRAAVVAAYAAGEPVANIAARHGVAAYTVHRYATAAGLLNRHAAERARGRDVDPAAFDQLDEPAIYWMGFPMTAGTGRADEGGAVELFLPAADRGHVAAFCRFIGAGEPTALASRRGRVGLVIRSPELLAKLVTFGVKPTGDHGDAGDRAAESLALDRHYWRGALDGRSNVTFATASTAPRLSLQGPVPLMKQYAAFVGRVSGDKGPAVRIVRRRAAVDVTGKRAAVLLAEVYRDAAVVLARKAEAAGRVIAQRG